MKIFYKDIRDMSTITPTKAEGKKIKGDKSPEAWFQVIINRHGNYY